MAAINFDEGLQGILAEKYQQTAFLLPVNKVRLFTAISPSMSTATVKANLTEVGAVMGYAAKTITGTDFAFSLDTVNHWVIATAVYTWTFTPGAGLTILGWWGGDATNTKAILGETFAAGIVIPAGGGSLQLTISDKYKDC
jgi:hypothetical protein